MNGRADAVEALAEFGFTEYQARAFVSLLELGEATAKQVSEASEVPRTRVYDAMEDLHDRGLVDIQYATPKVYAPVSREAVREKFERETDRALRRLGDALQGLDGADGVAEEPGVWTVTGRTAVVDRLTELVAGAETEAVVAVEEGCLSSECLSAFADAGRRGVTVRVARVSERVRREVLEAVPGAEPHDAGPDWTATPVARLVLVDRSRVLASVATADDAPETAIWAAGRRNSLVALVRATFLQSDAPS